MYAKPDSQFFTRTRGNRQYELKNHLGNVLATVTDRKIPQDNDPDQFVDYYEADVASASDYYPFGMQMPGRSYPEPNHDTAVHDTVIYGLLAHYQSSSGDSQLENREAIANYLNDTLNTTEETEAWMSALEAKGIIRDSLYVDGTASNVDFGKKPQYEVGTNGFTIEAWFYYPSSSSAVHHSILSNVHFNENDKTFNGYSIFLQTDHERLYFMGCDGSGAWGNSAVKIYCSIPSPGEWHHVVAVRDGNDANDWEIYVDGVNQNASIDAGKNNLNSGDLTANTIEEMQIGSKRNGQPNGSRFFEGSLKEVRLYERRLDGSEVAANYNAGCIGGPANTSDLLLHAPLDEGTGSVIEDHSPYEEIGELVNSAYTWERGLGAKRCLNGTMELSTGDNEGYRFGFNGKEKDNSWNGSGNMYNYKARMHDPRLGRFLSADTLIEEGQEYQDLSPYQFAGNTPIQAEDLDGLEPNRKFNDMLMGTEMAQQIKNYEVDKLNNVSDRISSQARKFQANVLAPRALEGSADPLNNGTMTKAEKEFGKDLFNQAISFGVSEGIGFSIDKGLGATKFAAVLIGNGLVFMLTPKTANAPGYNPDFGEMNNSATNEVENNTIEIENGDTFWGIENERNLEHGSLENANPEKDPRDLKEGDELNLPSKNNNDNE